MKIIIEDNYENLSHKAAEVIKEQIGQKPDSVLGLATGGTPIGTYNELVKMYQNGEIDFSEVTAFNLDEYLGIEKKHEQSYHYYMQEKLFNKINIKKENIFIPESKPKNPEEYCKWYENKIKEKGGIDLQLLGIGSNGHIGFNEPGSDFKSKTRVIELAKQTIEDNSRYFNSEKEVPNKAITMGLDTIFKAKKIIILASGEKKKKIVKKIVNLEQTEKIPATILKKHPKTKLIIDKAANTKDLVSN